MGIFSKKVKSPKKPYPQEMEHAKMNPNGWVYRIAGQFPQSEAVPPEAIVGAWQVDSKGQVMGKFQNNPKYDAKKFPV